MKAWGVVLLLLVAVAVSAQTLVKADQGKPGTQGPWPVTCVSGCSGGGGSGGSSSIVAIDGGYVRADQGIGLDGGLWKVQSMPGNCISRANSFVDGGLTALPVPTTVLANRYYVNVCNSIQNPGTPQVKCRGDGTNPVMAIGNPGDVLGVGDCVVYNQTAAVACIADTATTGITSFECGP